ncbi:MAG: methionyl-tRNA formyltransferase [Gammaproteobacteria bacterium]|nr:methionyl-tRNA formyltransferase [Gammaproteobacteria bacterium]
MRIIFAGTPDFAVPCLQAVIDCGHDIVAVYTQPDRPAGRGRKLKASPVKVLALDQGIEVRQPLNLKDADVQQALAELKADLMVVVAYGLILPKVVLDLPRRGCVNVHASLLPRWRGAAPIQRAILAGDEQTGVCLMKMDVGLDTGDIYAECSCPIGVAETASELHDRLSALGAELLVAQLGLILAGSLTALPQQDESCYAAKLEKQEAEIDWSLDAGQIVRQVMAFNSWPVAFTWLADKSLRIWRAERLEGHLLDSGVAGQVLKTGKQGIEIACGQGVVRLLEVQLAGARRISAGDFVNAHKLDDTVLGRS